MNLVISHGINRDVLDLQCVCYFSGEVSMTWENICGLVAVRAQKLTRLIKGTYLLDMSLEVYVLHAPIQGMGGRRGGTVIAVKEVNR